MSHEIVWEFFIDGVRATAECTDDDCISRYECTEECEFYYDVRREADGTVTHKPWADEIPAINRHPMQKSDSCNVVEWLNADSSLIPELAEAHYTFEVGRTSFEPIWHGEDGITWKRARA